MVGCHHFLNCPAEPITWPKWPAGVCPRRAEVRHGTNITPDHLGLVAATSYGTDPPSWIANPPSPGRAGAKDHGQVTSSWFDFFDSTGKERRISVSDLQESLREIDAGLDKIQKLAKVVVSAIARARSAVKSGELSEIPKTLAAIDQRMTEARAQAGDLPEQWTFDAAAYLSDGRFVNDLKAAAARADLSIFEKDGRIYCFPLLLRVEPKELGVKLGRRLERRINPSKLVQMLIRTQKAPQRFREEQFLNLLYQTWRQLVGGAWPSSGPGRVIALSGIYETLTLFPETDYPTEEFARDLLLLDRKPHLLTKDGCRFELPASTLSKGKTKRIIAYDEQGREHTYIGLRFVKDGLI